MCNHMICVEDCGYDGEYVHRAEKEYSWQKEKGYDAFDTLTTWFNYCPLCGVRLEGGKEIDNTTTR